MRIAVIHDLPSGGGKRVLVEQVRGLRERGHEMEAFVPATADETFLPLEELGVPVRTVEAGRPPDRERLLEGRASPVELLRWARYVAGLRAVQRSVARLADDAAPDVALVHPSQFTGAPLALSHLRTPAVYYCHEPLRAAWEPGIAPAPVRLLLRWTLGPREGRALRRTPAVAANSAYTARRLRELYGVEARVVHPGIDAHRFCPASPGDAPPGDYLLTVGALHPLKGLDFLVDVVGAVPDELRLPLTVVSDRGRERERRRIEARARERGVELDLRTRVGEEALVDLYRRARLVLYAPRREPLGLVPLEAMACGRPVLAVDEGGIPETVDDGRTGFLAPRDVGRFSARLRSLLESPGEAEAVTGPAREAVVGSWSWEGSLDALEALLAEAAR